MANAGSVPSAREQLTSTSRYELLVKIASGGMATVYVGRLSAAGGVRRLVAIKRAHAHLIEDPAFKKMLISEARLASQIHHPNVVAVQDVEELEGELLLVMEYVEGASLAELIRSELDNERPLPARLAVRIGLDACAGLHAAHELKDEDGKPLGLVHRDISPHNILVGMDGMTRIADFGIAKSSGSSGSSKTTTGELKGKIGYMAPEYIQGRVVDARADVFALGIVLWEALARRRLFRGAMEVETLQNVLSTEAPKLSTLAPWLGVTLDKVITKALEKSPEARWSSAQELADALERAARAEDLVGTHAEVGEHVHELVEPLLQKRRALIRSKSRPAVEAVPAPPPSELSSEALHEPSRTKTMDAPSPVYDAVEPPSSAATAVTSLRAIEPTESTDAHARGLVAADRMIAPATSRRGRWIGAVTATAVAAGITAAGFGIARSRTVKEEAPVGLTAAPTVSTPVEPDTADPPPILPAASASVEPTASAIAVATASPSASPRPPPAKPIVRAPPATTTKRPPTSPPKPTSEPAATEIPHTAPPNPYGDAPK